MRVVGHNVGCMILVGEEHVMSWQIFPQCQRPEICFIVHRLLGVCKNNQNCDVVTLLPIVVVVRRLNLNNPCHNLSPPTLFCAQVNFCMVSKCWVIAPDDKKGYLSVVIILLSFDDSIKIDHYLIWLVTVGKATKNVTCCLIVCHIINGLY